MLVHDFKDISVLPLAKTLVHDTCGFEAALMATFGTEVLGDKKTRRRQASRLSIVCSESGSLFRQAGFRGLPRRGCAFA
jgi:hypothetical protein